MAQNLASLNLTAAEVTALTGALQTIQTTLGNRGVSLDPKQRRELVKMGDKSRPFGEQAVAALQNNSASLPPDLDVTGLVQDLADFQKLDAFADQLRQVSELIDDTLKALSSDIMTNAIIGVGILKALNKLNPNLDTLLKDLSVLRRNKPTTKPAAPKP